MIASKSLGINYTNEIGYATFSITVYNPTNNEYEVANVNLSYLSQDIQGTSNEIVFDFENNKFYINDVDYTNDLYGQHSEITSLENITSIYV